MSYSAFWPYVSLGILLTIRIGATLRLTPFFGGKPLGLVPWILVSVVLASILVPQGGPLPQSEIGSLEWITLAVKELFVGVVVGILVRMAFLVFEVAGELARTQTLTIPDTGGDEGLRGAPLTRIYVLLGTIAFLLIGGHHAFIVGLLGTTRCMPPGAIPDFSHLAAPFIPVALHFFCTAMATAVLISAPIFVAGIFADFIIGLGLRLAPGMAPPAGVQAARALIVQVVLIATLGAAVSRGVGFLKDSMENIVLCS